MIKYIVWIITVIFLIVFETRFSYAQDTLEDRRQVPDTSIHYPYSADPNIPNDIEADLDNSFPRIGSVFGSLIPSKYFKWKTDLYDKVGLKLGASFQTMYTNVTPAITDENANDGWGAWVQLEGAWKLFRKEKDWEGSINFAVDGRYKLAGDIIPGELFFETGGQWGSDATYLPWDLYAMLLFWEQHVKYDRFWFRIGQIASAAVLDFFRFKDPRVSFLSPALTFPLHAIPYSAPGLGFAFKWKPIEGSGFYISGAINDLNADAGKFDWSGLFKYGEVFAGLEFGKNWVRSRNDFDHAHLLIFYADKRSSSPLPTAAGWGVKVHGSKQWNKIVAFANYTYNTSEGGGFGIFTIAAHAATMGIVRLDPLKIQGELGASIQMASPIAGRADMFNQMAELNPDMALFPGARKVPQYGAEFYWRILMLKQFWVTPGIQFFVNPTYNISNDFMVAPHIKVRLFL